VSYGLRDVLLACEEFAQDGTADTGGPFDTFNDLLATYRTEKSLDAGDLPDIALWTLDPYSAAKFPLGYIVPEGGSGEIDLNQHNFEHRVTWGFEVPDSKVDGSYLGGMLACASYVDVLLRMLVRRGSADNSGSGHTLNLGGTSAPGAIVNVRIDGYTIAPFVDPDTPHFFAEVQTTIEVDQEQ